MTKINRLSILIIALLTITSCHVNNDGGIFNCIKGEGNTITKEIFVSDFIGVKLKISSDVYITQGEAFSVKVTAQENIINELERDVINGIWEIEFDRCTNNFSEMRIDVTMPEVDYLAISGSGTIYGQNNFEVDLIDLKISGSGDMVLDLNASKIDAKISGSGVMKLKGEADNVVYNISGSGDYLAFDLQANTAETKISGSGDIEVNAADYLKVAITGSGDVFYKSNPSLDISITGSGRVYDSN